MGFNRLTWGVKASFRSYVEGAGGSIVLSDGATRAQDGTFIFEAVPGGDLTITSDGSAAGAMRFQGTVTFEAHGGMLKATLTELGLEVGTDGLVLTALDAVQLDRRQRCLDCDVAGRRSGLQHQPVIDETARAGERVGQVVGHPASPDRRDRRRRAARRP